MMRQIVRGCVLALLLAAPAVSAQVRDTGTGAPTGTASLSGRALVPTLGEPAPVRRARVTLECQGGGAPWLTDTDIDGKYRFDGLPTGACRLRAEKLGFVPRESGAASTAAFPIQIGAGAPVMSDILLQHGAAIEGRVVNDRGEPARNMIISVLRLVEGPKGREPQPVTQVQADDLGRFRAHTLQAGAYYLEASIDLVQARREGLGPNDPSDVSRTYYPDTARLDEAHAVSVQAGQEVSGVDFAVASVALSALPFGPASQQTSEPVAAGRIAGHVTRTDGGAPIRDAMATLVQWNGVFGQQLHRRTDAEGRFEFSGLLVGSYQLMAEAPGFVSLELGQGGPTDLGRRIDLRDNEQFEKADIALLRTSAIEGRVLDEFGDGAPDVAMQIARVDFAAGKRRLTPVGGSPERTTDDRGQFRVSGLAPGDYYVLALSGPFVVNRPPGTTVSAPRDDRAGFATTFFPGTTVPTDARPVTVAAGQDASDVSFPLAPTRQAILSGIVNGADGRPAVNALVMLMQLSGGDVRAIIPATGLSGPDGAFMFRNVPWGPYVLHAYMPALAGFGSLLVLADRAEVSDLAVAIVPSASAHGRIVFEGDGPPPAADQVRVEMRLVDLVNGPMRFGTSQPHVNHDWSFDLSGLTGPGIVRATGPVPWVTKSVTLNGVDVTDAALDFRGKDIDGLEVVMTSHSASIAGAVSENGKPVADYRVVVFPVDPAKWAFPSRFLATSRAGRDGTFKIAGLPASDYLVIALPAVQGPESQDPEFLEPLRTLATRVTLGDGDAKTIDLKLVRR